MILSSKTKNCIVWMVLVCMFAIVSMPVFLYAESGAYKLIVDDNTYELVNEPYENYMGLIVNAEDLMNAFELQYEFDDRYKSFEIFCEDTSVMLMHEATHYYKGEESIECLPYFFVENGPMIELGLFCEIFGKEYLYNKDEKIISIKQKEAEISVAEEAETKEDVEESVEEPERIEKNSATEFIETEINLENDDKEDIVEENLDSEAEKVIEAFLKNEPQQMAAISLMTNITTHDLSGTITLENPAPAEGLEVQLILQPITNLISQTYGTSYYEVEDAYSLGMVSFDSGETAKDYIFDTTGFYNDSDYPRFCVYVKVIKKGKVESIRYISEYDDYTYQTSDILTFSRIAAYTPIRKFSFAHNEISNIEIPGIDYSEGTLSGTITLPEAAPRGGLEISLILQAVSTLKTTSYGVNYYSLGYAYKNVGSVTFEQGETTKDYEFEVDKYYENLDYPNYAVYYETDLNNYFERYGCYEADGDTGSLNYAPLYGEIRESSQIKAFEFGKSNMADINVIKLTSNKCGPNANWEFDSDSGVLTISGTGEMYDYYDWPSLWNRSSVVERIVIEEGITYIGSYSFPYLSNLRSVELPKTIEKIGACAFRDCYNLEYISIPEGIQVIESGAFVFCDNLKTIFLPKTLLRIGSQAFNDCFNLTDVFYGGSEDDWNALFIDDWNDDLTNADIVCTNGAQSLFKTGSHGMIINGKNCTSEATPVWINGKMFAPVRPVADSVGATAEWNGTLRTLTFTKDDISVTYSNEDENITNVDGRVYVSVDDVWCDFFGPGYEWMTWMSDWGEWCMSARNLSEVEDIITVAVDKAKGRAGQIIEVPIYIENNPGIAGLQLNLTYNENLTLTEISSGDALLDLDFTPPGDFDENPVTLAWDGLNADDSNGTILTLSFQTSKYIEEGFYPILIEPIENGIYGDNLKNVECKIINGGISIINYLPGDINGDGVVGTKDVTVLRRYIAGGYDVTVVDEALDVNGDGEVTTKDVTVLRRFIAGGYGIELK